MPLTPKRSISHRTLSHLSPRAIRKLPRESLLLHLDSKNLQVTGTKAQLVTRLVKFLKQDKQRDQRPRAADDGHDVDRDPDRNLESGPDSSGRGNDLDPDSSGRDDDRDHTQDERTSNSDHNTTSADSDSSEQPPVDGTATLLAHNPNNRHHRYKKHHHSPASKTKASLGRSMDTHILPGTDTPRQAGTTDTTVVGTLPRPHPPLQMLAGTTESIEDTTPRHQGHHHPLPQVTRPHHRTTAPGTATTNGVTKGGTTSDTEPTGTNGWTQPPSPL